MSPVNEKNSGIVDAQARQQALDVTRSFIVQAPAGSGKTGLLILRYLALLATVENPEEVIAITFTRKAASEMRNRVLSAFARVDDPEPEDTFERQTRSLAIRASEHARHLQWSIQDQPSRLRITTIDAFNASLVRQMPWLSGTGSETVIHDDPEPMYREAAWATLSLGAESGEVGQVVRTLLLHLDNNSRRLVELLIGLYHRRDQWIRHLVGLRLRPERRQMINRYLQQAIEAELLTLRNAIPADLVGDIIELAAIAAGGVVANGGDSPIGLCQNLDDLPAASIESVPLWQGLVALYTTQTGWRSKFTRVEGLPPEKRPEKERIRAISLQLAQQNGLFERFSQIRRLPTGAVDDEQWQVLDALIEILPMAAAQLKLTFKQHGAIDFIEQSQAADTALGTSDAPTDLALSLDYRIHHILMDEFQDTSYSQHRLLEKMVAGWQEGDGRTLFLVGDPMQSIYGFREADVSGFLQVRENGIASLQLNSLVLRTNFRSTPRIVDWVNDVFPFVMPVQDDISLGGIHYEASTSASSDDETSKVEIRVAKDRGAEQEAQEIVELIQAVQRDNMQKTIGVLVRSRTHLHDLTPALDTSGIVYQAIEITPLQNRPVVIDLISLTRAMLHHHDRIAWLAILRAPWCGLTLEALHGIVDERKDASVWEMIQQTDRLSGLDADSRQRLERVESVLHPWFAQHRLSLRTGVEWAWRALGGPVCYGEQAVESDADVYFELLDRMESGQNELTIDELYRKTSDLFAKPSKECHSAGNHLLHTVQLMSIHKSKGLEFDVVIVPGLERQPRSEDKPLLVWHEEQFIAGQAGLLIAPLHSPGKEDLHYEYVRQRTLRRRRYETQRLLYVAVTRARHQAYLFGSASMNTKGEWSNPHKHSLLSLLWPVISTEIIDGRTESQPPGETAYTPLESHQILLRRLPADWQQVIEQTNVKWQETGQLYQDTDHIEFSWAGEIARHIGTVTHQFLCRIADSPMLNQGRFDIQVLHPGIRAALASTGVDSKLLDAASDSVSRALLLTIQDSRGYWILTGDSEQKTEYAISGLHQGRLINRVIDRTFVDKDNTRWIIDYKTSAHAGSDVEDFLNNEKVRYQSQLDEYAALLSHRENRSIKLGLYFPLLQGWREWGY